MFDIRKVDEEKMRKVEEYANNNVDLTSYIKDMGFNVTGGVMSCPFHGSDSTPSLRINGSKWHCFGCGRGGGLIKFKHECDLLENHHSTYYKVVEDFQKTIPELSRLIGGTIFKTQEETFEEGWNKMLSTCNENCRKPNLINIKSYDSLIRKAKDKPVDIKMQFLGAMQSGLSYNLLKDIIDGTDLTGTDLDSLADIMLSD